ncbi:Gfo/Idh/MocA family protein [Palleronia caenipelagi]|uniref:Gfo/Idh/MocA family oxidoreductase n=1 Tax=Palleronia caenipelagi TaxID=2489174 RepID=A0A547PQ54_9RHOB|nr:Gfo/Idh/MocA family oxidoreductase [Palleronia caenipelagi]TRD16250.1 Gfo/Idh/MocA family oxidoreductase [Palleronia caenipelagi]
MSQSLKLAIAGVGLIGKRHAAAMEHMRDVSLSAVVDPSEAGRAFAVRRGLPCFDTLEALFTAETVDGVIIATPTLLHAEMGSACVTAGIPALIEKPLTTRAEDALALVRASEARGVPLLVGHHRRHNPLIQKAREVIDAGRIGDVRAIHATCWFHKPDDYFDAAPWRKKFGAGPISVNLVHDVDLIRYLCGDVVSVQGQAAPSRRGYENEDVAAAVLRFESGAIGTITVSDSIASPWSWELTSGENPIYPATQESCYMIGGSTGAISVPDLRVWSHTGERPDWWSDIAATSLVRENSDPLINQIRHFAEVIRGEAQPLVSGREGLRTMQVLEALQTACLTGTGVTITALDLPEREKTLQFTG